MEKIKKGLGNGITKARTHYQYILSAALVAVLIFIVYGNDLEILANEALQNEALNYILLMPFFAGFLFYIRRDAVKAALALEKCRKKTTTRHLDEIVGVALCLIAFLTYWYGSYTFYPLEYHILSLPIFIAGVTLILFNLKALIALILPILFLAFLIPMPTELLYQIGGILANANTQASYALLKTFGIPVSLSTAYGPPTITLPISGNPTPFSVDVPCSGIYSLMAFTTFAAFLVLVSSGSIPKKALLFVLGFFMFEALNIVRITTIVSIANSFGEETAMLLYHAVAGILLIFIGMLIILFIAERFMKMQILPKKQEQPPCPQCKTTASTLESFCQNCGRLLSQLRPKITHKFWTKLLLLILGSFIVSLSINAPTFVSAKGPIGVTSNQAWTNATNVFPQIQNYSLSFFREDLAYEQAAHQDKALWYYYASTNGSKPPVWVAVGVSSSLSNLHNWEVCYVTWRTAQGQSASVSVLDQRDTQLLQDTPLIARYFVFITEYNSTQVTLYWYEKATFNTGITVEQKYVRISLIILTPNSTDYQHHEEELYEIGQTIASYWQPLQNQSLISLGIPAQQLLLSFSIGFVIFTKTAQYSNDWRRKTNNQKIFNKLGTPKEKYALHTIQELTKEKRTIETRDVTEAIQKKTGKTVNPDKLLTLLNHLEEYGFIKKDITITQSQPRLIWKAKY